ncbi:kinase D-interacting substrate of 220 kDa-like [Branchiostoma floridae x Branchiostoma japonicum]
MDESANGHLDPLKMPHIRYKKLHADNNPDFEGELTLVEDNSRNESSRLLEDNNSGDESSSTQEDLGTSISGNVPGTAWDRGSSLSLLSNLSEHHTASDSEDKIVAPKPEELLNVVSKPYGSLESFSSAQSLIILDGEEEETQSLHQTHCAVEMDDPLSTTQETTAVKEEDTSSWKQSAGSAGGATQLSAVHVQVLTGRPGERVMVEPTGNGDKGDISASDVVPLILEDDSPPPHNEKFSISTNSSGVGDGDPLGYDIFARSIAEIVTDQGTEMPLTVGVYGEFGMGKTHLLGQVKDKVNKMIKNKREEHEEYHRGEVDGLKQNQKRKRKQDQQKAQFPVVLFSNLLVTFVLFLIATVVCAVYEIVAWEAILIFAILFFVALLATLVHAYRRNIQRWCTKRIPFLQKANPMYWMVGVYLDWVEPPVMSKTPRAQRYEVIWVDFNAWEFSGCKVLWAGIVTTLCDAIEAKIGATPARFYRVIKSQVEGWKGGKKSLIQCGWFKILLAVVLGVILSSLVGIFVLVEGTKHINTLIATVSQVLGLGIVVNIKSYFKVAKNLVKSQKDVLNSQMKKPDFADQLGFMSEVKAEVKTVTSLLRFLEHVTGIQYRVIIMVDDLDCCPGDRVVGVLEAMNILLSDEGANFVSIIAMDPTIVVNCLESRLKDIMINNASGYEYLKRIVHVPVCLPEPNVGNRRDLFRDVVRGKPGIIMSEIPSSKSPGKISFKAGSKARQKLLIDSQGRWSRKCLSALPDAPRDLGIQDGVHGIQDGGQGIQDGGHEFQGDSYEIETGSGEFQNGGHQSRDGDPIDLAKAVNGFLTKLGTKAANQQDQADGKFNIDFLGDVIQVIVQDDDDDDINDIMFYVHGNAHHIANIYHVLRMTVKVLKHRKLLQFVTPRQVASWVVLAEQWPYRLSWVLQFVEDSQQKESIRQRSQMMTDDNELNRRLSLLESTVSGHASLFRLFETVKREMSRVDAKEFARLNNLDGDPEMFELLLLESRMTVQEMMTLLPCTINLDWSIQRRIAVARSLNVGE